MEIKDFTPLLYGENIHQAAEIAPIEGGVEYEILSEEKTLGFADYVNLSKVLEILGEFFDVNAVACAKDGQLCSVALGANLDDAYQKVVDNDALSIIESTVGFSKEISLELAKQLKSMKVKNVLAPKFSSEALKYFIEMTKTNLIKVKSPLQELLGFNAKDIKVTPFGYLVQEQNHSKLTKSSFKVAGKTKPTQQLAEDAIFAWKIAKYTKSNSAVVVKDLATKALVQGAQSLNFAVETVLDNACEAAKESVLAIDGVMETEEIINAAVQNRCGLIIEAGDASCSDKLVKLADKYNLVLIKTGIRNYRY